MIVQFSRTGNFASCLVLLLAVVASSSRVSSAERIESSAASGMACERVFYTPAPQDIMQPVPKPGYASPIIKLAQGVVAQRYNLTIKGNDEVAAKGRQGILFAMNHPSFSDPAIVTIALREYQPSPVMSLGVTQIPIIGKYVKCMADQIDAIYLPKKGTGLSSAERHAKINELIQETIERLKRGENIVLWPAGELMRENRSSLGSNRMIAEILKAIPDVRVVLGRTSGMWGSAFGYAPTGQLDIARAVKKGLEAEFYRLTTGPLTPRRDVGIELFEPADLPRDGGRATVNAYIENWYNSINYPNISVPYNPVDRLRMGKQRVLPEGEK
jgi:acyl-[acyl-carrier-protein]-phospholipid O-acyltransferase/long-chain-fatty-acid--[acyl-carrier-protein] ligase